MAVVGRTAAIPGPGHRHVRGGIGWVPMLLDRADYVLEHSASGTESTSWPSDLRPSEVLRRNFWFCTIDDPSTVELRHRIGVDHIMVESDYPHADSTWPDTQIVLEKTLGHLPEQELRMMAAGNAARLFRHPMPPADDWRVPAQGAAPPAAPRRRRDRNRPPGRRRRRARGGASPCLGDGPRAVPACHHERRARIRARRGGRQGDPGGAAGHAGHTRRALLGPEVLPRPRRRAPGRGRPRGTPDRHGHRGHRPGGAVPVGGTVLLGTRRPRGRGAHRPRLQRLARLVLRRRPARACSVRP